MKARFIDLLTGESVSFDYNPEKLILKRSAATKHNQGATPGNAGSTPSIFLKSSPRHLTGSGYLVGEDVQDRVDLLNCWLDPGGGMTGRAVAAAAGLATAVLAAHGGPRIKLAAKLPALRFEWGAQIMRCVLTRVDTTLERFAASGAPLRATVKFAATEEVDLLAMLPTNPTSGGEPGRRRHTLTEGESLQTVGQAVYGRAAAWRGIAETNGIDDPFRIVAGTAVLLPNPDELRRADIARGV